jgi:hypothetical protein
MRFTLYPIYWVADPHVDREPFDRDLLPFDITDSVRIEAVADRFRPGTFALGVDRHGSEIREQLEAVRMQSCTAMILLLPSVKKVGT